MERLRNKMRPAYHKLIGVRSIAPTKDRFIVDTPLDDFTNLK